MFLWHQRVLRKAQLGVEGNVVCAVWAFYCVVCQGCLGHFVSSLRWFREVAQRVDVLESRIACDMDAFKDDVVARLSSVVDSVSELETTLNAFRLGQSSQLASLFTSLEQLDLQVSEVGSNLQKPKLQISEVGSDLQCVRVCFCDKDSGLWSGGGYSQVQVCCARSGCTCFSHFSTACELRFRVHG